jgi:YidC/Oxa1 family membrane protein insertase
MAKAPAPKNMSVFWVIWALSTFGMLYMFNNQNKTVTPPTDTYKAILTANKETKDHSIVSLNSTYGHTLESQIKEGKLKPEEAEAKKIETAVLVANTQLRAGLNWNDSGRIRLAYQTLWAFQKKLLDKPEWRDTQVTSAPDSRFPEVPQSASGQQLFEVVSETLSARNKKDVVWGFIPGGYTFIDSLIALTGRNPSFSYAFGALILALIVRALIFPFAQKSIMHARQMSQLSPLMTEIREKFKDDPQQMNMKVMELYKEYGLNPAGGCAPAFVQMPLFLTVYQFMLLYQFEFQKGYFLWINPHTSKLSNGFIAPNLGTQDTILIIIYGISMIISQMLTPISDPSQKRQIRLMGIGISVLFTFFMFTGAFPVVGGFVLYWTFTNILATAQSLRAYRLPLEPLQKVNTKDGGVYPTDPSQMFPWMRGAMGQKPTDAGKPAGKKGKSSSSSDNSAIKGSTKTGKPQQHKPKK